jgi:hypothetical protein
VRLFLLALPNKFKQIAASIKTLLDLETITICDILAQGFNRIDEILIPSRYTFFYGNPPTKNSGVKRA